MSSNVYDRWLKQGLSSESAIRRRRRRRRKKNDSDCALTLYLTWLIKVNSPGHLSRYLWLNANGEKKKYSMWEIMSYLSQVQREEWDAEERRGERWAKINVLCVSDVICDLISLSVQLRWEEEEEEDERKRRSRMCADSDEDESAFGWWFFLLLLLLSLSSHFNAIVRMWGEWRGRLKDDSRVFSVHGEITFHWRESDWSINQKGE